MFLIKIICNSLKRGFAKNISRVHMELMVSNLFNDTHNIYVYIYMYISFNNMFRK